MTHNQIAYATLQETRRHNVAVEDETKRNAMAVLEETQRHNVSQEHYWSESNAINSAHYKRIDQETQRHNIASERIENRKVSETQRHNLASEIIEVGKLDESATHNRATESTAQYQAEESARHNVETERVSAKQADTAAYQAETSRQQIGINSYNAITSRYDALKRGQSVDSDISLNKKRESDLDSQIQRRKLSGINETIKSVVDVISSSAENARDRSVAVKNTINSITDVIKLLPGI